MKSWMLPVIAALVIATNANAGVVDQKAWNAFLSSDVEPRQYRVTFSSLICEIRSVLPLLESLDVPANRRDRVVWLIAKSLGWTLAVDELKRFPRMRQLVGKELDDRMADAKTLQGATCIGRAGLEYGCVLRGGQTPEQFEAFERLRGDYGGPAAITLLHDHNPTVRAFGIDVMQYHGGTEVWRLLDLLADRSTTYMLWSGAADDSWIQVQMPIADFASFILDRLTVAMPPPRISSTSDVTEASMQQLAATLRGKPDWKGRAPRDAWGRRLHYTVANLPLEYVTRKERVIWIWSPGADGRADGRDDIIRELGIVSDGNRWLHATGGVVTADHIPIEPSTAPCLTPPSTAPATR